MKFAILTDIHMGPEGYYNKCLRKINKDVKRFLAEFIEKMNVVIEPDFVVVLGDLVEDDSPKNDKNNISYIRNSLKNLKCPAYYAAGNHDLRNLTESGLKRLFGQNRLYYSFDSNNLHFIVLFSKVIENGNIEIPKEQIEWLKKDLEKTNKKSVVFVHHGLAEQDLTGNPWFEGKPEKCLIKNRKSVRKIFEKSGRVIAVFNSHLHWDKKHAHNSIPYFTIQSLVENEDNKGIASEAYAVVTIKNNKINVSINGRYSKNFLHAP